MDADGRCGCGKNVFFFVSPGGVPLTKPPATPAAPAMRVAVSVPESGPGWS